jgi:hypothetical protein
MNSLSRGDLAADRGTTAAAAQRRRVTFDGSQEQLMAGVRPNAGENGQFSLPGVPACRVGLPATPENG